MDNNEIILENSNDNKDTVLKDIKLIIEHMLKYKYADKQLTSWVGTINSAYDDLISHKGNTKTIKNSLKV